MVHFIKAKEGHEFVLTELGFEQAHVRNKYNKNDANYTTQYSRAVPISWIEKHYVSEVKSDGTR